MTTDQKARPSPIREWMDPVVIHARREAWVILGAFVVFLMWSVSWCYLAGYPGPTDRPPAQVFGIPSWVFWGVLVPWIAADVFALWFCFFFMADDPLSDAESDGDAVADKTAECDSGQEGRNA